MDRNLRQVISPAYISHLKYLGATTYATAVATLAGSGFDTDSTKIGVQPIVAKTSLPTGGIRDNKSDPKALLTKKKVTK